MINRSLAALVLAASLPCSTSSLPQSAPSDAWTTAIDALAPELKALGFELPQAGARVEVLDAAAFEALFARERARVLGASYFELQRALRQALTLDVGKTPEEFRSRLASRTARGATLRYDFERDVLAVLASAVPSEDDAALAHELARAALDRSIDLGAWFESAPRSTELARVRDSWLEGAAGFAVIALQQRRNGRDLAALQPANFDGVGLLASEDPAFEMVLARGRDTWLNSFRALGPQARSEGWSHPPPSTEQVLHAAKLAHDAPRVVALPAWPEGAGVAEIVHEDTLGELELTALLRDLDLPRQDAARAAIGWDGDRMQLVRAKTGELAVVWRIVFDRAEDSRQFAAVWASKTSGAMAARGPAFDWVRSDSVRLANALAEALHAAPQEKALDDADRASTEALELALPTNPAVEPRMVGDRWLDPRFGVAIRLPAGWLPGTLNGQPHLLGEPDSPFRDRIQVLALENPEQKSLATLLEEHRTQIAGGAGNTVVVAEQRKVGGKDVLYLRYDIELDQRVHHLTSTIYLLGGKEVIVTASIGPRTWPKIGSEIEQILNDLTFEAPKPARKDAR